MKTKTELRSRATSSLQSPSGPISCLPTSHPLDRLYERIQRHQSSLSLSYPRANQVQLTISSHRQIPSNSLRERPIEKPSKGRIQGSQNGSSPTVYARISSPQYYSIQTADLQAGLVSVARACGAHYIFLKQTVFASMHLSVKDLYNMRSQT